MQRDLKFVRDILQHVVGTGAPIKLPMTIPDYEYPMHQRETNFLVELCMEAGFLKTHPALDDTYIESLTWAGYDMLDTLNGEIPIGQRHLG